MPGAANTSSTSTERSREKRFREGGRNMEIRKRQRREGGFTLIELITVIIILGILAAVVTPPVLQHGRRRQTTPPPRVPWPKARPALNLAYAQYIIDNTGTPPDNIADLQTAAYLGTGNHRPRRLPGHLRRNHGHHHHPAGTGRANAVDLGQHRQRPHCRQRGDPGRALARHLHRARSAVNDPAPEYVFALGENGPAGAEPRLASSGGGLPPPLVVGNAA